MPDQNPPKKSMLYNAIIVLLVILFLQAFIFPIFSQPQVTDVTYDQFLSMLDAGNITQVAMDSDTILFVATDGTEDGVSRIYRTGAWPDDSLTDRLLEHPEVSFETEIIEETSPLVEILVGWILPYVLIFGMGYLLMRSMRKRMAAKTP